MRRAMVPSRIPWRVILLIIALSAPALAENTEAPASNIVNDVIQHLDDSIAPPPATQITTAPDQSNQPDDTGQNAAQDQPPAAQGIPGIVPAGDNAALPPVPQPPPTFEDHKTVILRALDKVTARTKTFEVPVGQQFYFGALTIAVRACRARPPLEPADAAAFLQIVEQKPGEPLVPRFSGWMFASAPSLSALEHPVYDVWVVGCGGEKIQTTDADKPAAPANTPASPAPPAAKPNQN